MDLNRRSFLELAGLGSIGSIIPMAGLLNGCTQPVEKHPAELPHLQTAKSEGKLWEAIRQYYIQHPNLVNLNSGACSPSAIHVLRVFQEAWQVHNQLPGMSLVTESHNLVESARNIISNMVGSDPMEIAMLRNATEGLENVIFGFPLSEGDEVILTDLDYPHVLNAWKRRQAEEGIKLVQLSLKIPATQEEILQQFQAAITDRTKFITVTHVISWNGQILPAFEIASLAAQRGIPVLVDGAHSFGLLPAVSAEIPGDFFATGLQKWFGLPAGAGFLKIKQDRISEIVPRFAPYQWMKNRDIRKLEVTGVRPLAQLTALSAAKGFLHAIGLNEKYAYLQSLKQHLVEELKKIQGLSIRSPEGSADGSPMLAIRIEHLKPQEAYNLLLEKGFFTGSLLHPRFNGIRLSPDVFNDHAQMKGLIQAIRGISA